MPQVPMLTSQSVLPDRANPVYQRFDVNADMFGAGVGRAMQGFGQEVSQFGAVIAANQVKMQNERNTADANNEYLKATVEKGDVDANYFSLEGANAVDQHGAYVKQLEEIRQKHIANLGNDKAKKLFDNDFTREVVNGVVSASKYAATQHKAYVSGQSDARVQSAINDSAAKFGDQGAFDNNIGVIGREVDNKAKSEGWAPEKLAFEKSKAEGLAYAARIREMAIYQPFEAEKLFHENMGRLDPDAVPTLENAIRTAKQTIGVQQIIGSVRVGGDVARPSLVRGMMSLEPYKTDPTADLEHVSHGLTDAMARGMTHMPPGVGLQVTEGYVPATIVRNGRVIPNPAHAPQSKHKIPGIGAVDYTLTLNGKPIPNSGADTTGLYGRFSKFTLMELQANHPELVPHYRYGGTFETSAGSGRADLGHMDVGGGGGPRITGRMLAGAGGTFGRAGGQGFIRRIAYAEGGGAGVISPKNAMGIMQVTEDAGKQAAAEMGIEYSREHLLNDNSYNVMIGKHILNRLLHKYSGNEIVAAAAYNSGEGTVAKALGGGGLPSNPEEVAAFVSRLPNETQGYVKKVMGSDGVGYDPTPGSVHYVQNQNAPGAPIPLSVQLEQGATAAEQMAPGDPDIAERVQSGIRTQHNIQEAAQAEQEAASYDFVWQTALTTKATSEGELFVNEQVKKAYENIHDPAKKSVVHNLLESNSKADLPVTTAMLKRYDEISGQLAQAGSSEERAKIDIYDPSLSRELLGKLIEKKNTPVPDKVTAESKVNVTRALDVIGPALSAARIYKLPESATGTAADKTRADYNAFYGAFSEEINRFAEENKRPPTDDEIRQIGNDLLQKRPADYQDTWSLWHLSGQYHADVPLFLMNKEQVQNYLSISPEAADVVMSSEVPDDIEAQIKANYLRKTGHQASTEFVWQVYQEGEMQKLRKNRK